MPSQCADYEAVALWKSGTRIAWPRVVGVAVEKAFKVADASHGVGALGPDDLGGFVLFNYVKWRGDVEVGLKAFDAPLAVEADQAGLCPSGALRHSRPRPPWSLRL